MINHADTVSTESTVTPETPCVHCGLPVGRHPIGVGPWFCCTGCQVVFDALQTAGMGATYYKLRDVAPSLRQSVRPVATSLDALQAAELDAPGFLETNTREVSDGVRTTDLFLDGVHCAACVWLVEQLPYAVDGVVEARLDLPRARLSLTWQPERVALSRVAGWLTRFGYGVYPGRREGLASRTRAEHRLLVKVGMAWALAGNVMLIAFALYAGLDLEGDRSLATAARYASLLLAIPSVFYCGSEFLSRARASVFLALRTRRLQVLHMDTPIAIGILAGFAQSTAATLLGRGDVWFDSIAVLIAALLTARWLQLRSRRLAGDATERLLALIPTMVRRVRDDGTTDIVRGDALLPNELVLVPAGEVIPVDGTIVAGETRLDNAVLTGENRPVAAGPQSLVQAGATNVSSPIQVRVAHSGDQTRVGRLLTWIRDQDAHRAPVMLLANRLSGFFVATVLLLAAATAVLWSQVDASGAVEHTVALLVVTCPCALGMATPLAMTIAAGRAARTGIFIKSDEAIQNLTRVDTVVLDKTGTLTEGRMELAEYDGPELALDLAAALEAESSHPIALALVRARTGEASGYACTSVAVSTGNGISGTVDGHEVLVGRPEWVAASSRATPASHAQSSSYAAAGLTPVFVALDGNVTAVLGFGDRMRPSTFSLVETLRASGKDIYVLSGDHPGAVQAVAARMGLSAAHAMGGLSPEEKQAFVSHLRARGHVVAMIGDGVNDAAALQDADVGIAVHGGSTASMVAADVFLTHSGLEPVEALFGGAHAVMRVIRRNLAISLVYNLLGAGFAIAGMITPIIAAVAMPVSSLAVVTSSILQRSFKSGRNGGLPT